MSGDALEIWSFILPDGRSRAFALCAQHSAMLRASQDALNEHFRDRGISLARFHIPEGALVTVSLPPEARCSECFGLWPSDKALFRNESQATGGKQ